MKGGFVVVVLVALGKHEGEDSLLGVKSIDKVASIMSSEGQRCIGDVVGVVFVRLVRGIIV